MAYAQAMRHLTLATALACCLPAASAVAHPHVFVVTAVNVIYEDGRPAAVELSWIYDEYFSLLLTADLGIDLDGDLVLTSEEEAILASAVTDWPADFDGDLEVMQDGSVLSLGPKRDHRMEFRDGIVHEIHTRPLPEGLPDTDLTVRVYDPNYYTAYEVAEPVLVTGAEGCAATVTPPNLYEAYALVEELLYGRPASDVGPGEKFPEVGVKFAATITVSCDG